MGETDGDTEPQADTRSSTGPDERPSPGPGQDSLQVPSVKKRRKSPTPGSVRGRSMTPIRGRSQTPFTLYLTRRSATPSTWRSITPFLRREEREKTPFELGSNIKQQLFCNKAVFDKALVMDISEPEVEPVRYLTTDLSVIDRAAVMDVSNVEVIYVVEEYEEYESYTEEEEKEKDDEEKKKKKKPSKKKEAAAKKKEEAAKKREEAKAKKKAEKEKEKKEKEESPKLQLKLEIGGGPKASKKMFEQAPPPEPSEKGKTKPPPKKTKSKAALEMEKKAKAAAKAAEEAKKKAASKPKRETYEERQKRLKAEREAEEKARATEEASKAQDESRGSVETREDEIKEESLRQDEETRRKEADESVEREEKEESVREKESEIIETKEERQERKEQEKREREERRAEQEREETEEPTEVTEASESGEEEGGEDEVEESEAPSDAGDMEEEDEEGEEPEEDLEGEDIEEDEEAEGEEPSKDDARRGSGTSEESFIRPDPEEEEKWKRIAEEEGEEFMIQMRKASAQVRSEKERDADWKKQREASRLPAFVVFLTDRAAEEGHNTRLTCAVSGPDLSIKWMKDGKQLTSSPRTRIINNNNICSLELVNPTSADSGEYTCVISNANDEVSSSCIVTIYPVYKDEPSPPTFSSIRDFYHLHDDELTIECHLHGTPRPRVTWIKDSVTIKPSFKYTILEEAHGVYKLMIYRPSAKDSGKYICRAVNDSGEMEISHNVEFVKPKNFHVHGIFHAHDEFQKEKEESAKRAMEEALKSKEEYEKKRASGSGAPRIRHDEGPPVPPKNKLKFASQLRDRIATQGSTVKLMCSILGPDPAVRWFKDDNPLVVGPKIKNLSTENTAAIQLVNVSTENSGVYKCVAKNQYSEIDTSCYLKVYSAQGEGDDQEPMFALPMRDVYHSLENDLIIDTKVRGNPRPTISWLKDELAITLDARVQQIEHLDGICELIINKPTPKDSGKYTCIAENKLGSQKLTHAVVIQDIPASRRSSGSMGAPEEKQNKPKKQDAGDQKGKPPAKGKKKETDAPEGGRRRVAEPEPSVKAKLYFIGNISNRYVPEGSKVKLSAVIGGPDPQIKWMKNENNVVYGPRIKNMSREGLAVLEISNANVEDSGQYTCIARNSANEIVTTAILHVYQPNANADLEPMFTRALKDTYHLNTNELILESHVRGQPIPTVTWFKDSVEIPNNEKYQTQLHSDGTCELIIDKPVNNDSGKYVCRAENSLGKSEIFHHVLFEGKDSHIAENIHGVFHADPQYKKLRDKEAETERKPEKDLEDQEKGKGKAKGKAAKGSKTEAVPAPDKDGKVTKEEKREKKIGVHFAAKLTDRVVAEGSKVKLTCYVEGPDPQIRWLKNDQPVVYGPKVRQNYREGLCTLELLSASQSDSGNYKCYAKNSSGEAETVGKVTVYANPGTADVPPTFTRAIKDTYHAKINELILDCHVRGLPTPTISWAKDGVHIEPSEKYQQIDHEDGTCELVVNDPVPYDSGKYVCIAENRVDKAELVHLVQLSAKDIRHGSLQGTGPTETPKVEKTSDSPKEEKKKEKKKTAGEGTSGGRRSAAPPPDPKKKIHFATFLSNRTVAEGSNVRMTAYIEGPDPQCRWFKGETPIVYGPKTKSACQDGLAVLVLSNLSPQDSGEYSLVARNPENEISTSCNLTVYPKVKEEAVAPVFTVGIKDTYNLIEDELVLDCRVRGFPRPEIQWMKGTDFISNDDKYQQLDQADGYCKLVIRNPTQQDSGVYSCEARNAVNSEKMTHTVQFEGQDKFILEKAHGFFHRDPNKPHLTKPLGDHTIPTGGTMALQAEFAPTSSPLEVQWLKNKMPLKDVPNLKTFFDKGVYTLAIEKVTPDIAGTYTCRASNAFGRIESNANVHVVSATLKGGKPALFLSRPDGEMKIAVNDPFSISFRVQGDPKPKLVFMKGTKDITKSDRVSKEASDDYIRFTIQRAQIADSGTYFVVARNQHGSDRLFVTVTIKTPKKKN